MQYREIIAWRCQRCGWLLTTDKGRKSHATKCRYAVPVLPGQLTLADMEKGGTADNGNYRGAVGR